jgi:uncharacterized membrane protein
MGVPSVSAGGKRFQPMDAVRGTAMLFVFLSHFVEVYFKRHQIPLDLAYAITMVASPAFISISGAIMGILYRTKGGGFRQTRWRFIQRGLFLLTLGRVLILIAHIPFAGGWKEALRWGFMTDAIGLCILLGPTAMEVLRSRQRALLGSAIYAFSWIVILAWTPAGPAAGFVKELVFGPFLPVSRFFTDVFPLLPWLGLYLIGTSLGEQLGKFLVEGKHEELMRTTLRTGLIALVSSIALLGFRTLQEKLLGVVSIELHLLLAPLQKLPPGPVYFLFYAGCTFIFLWALIRFQDLRPLKKYSTIVEVLGRNSLFVFIVQYFVYFTFFAVVDFGPRFIWPIYFVLSASGIWAVAYLWERGKIHRSLSRAAL